MIIHTYEDGGRTVACKECLLENHLPDGINECIILPIPSTKDGVHLSGTDVLLDSVLNNVRKGVLVVGYSLPSAFLTGVTDRGGILYDAGSDEKFLVGNAELTAVAALGVILNSEKRVPRDMTFGIVGYGRIGKELTRHLLFLGSRIRVFTTRRDVRLLLSEFGVATSESTEGADLTGIDVLINTAPARIFDTDSPLFPKNMRVIDLASGNNFPTLLSYETYPSIPARMYPESSGVLLAEGAMEYIKKIKR